MLNYSRMYFLPSTIAAAFGKRKEKGNIPLDWVGKCFYCSWIHLWHLIPWATSNWKLNTNSLRMGFLRTTVAPAMATMASSNKTEYIFNLGKLKSLTHFHINFFSGTGDIPKEVKTFEMRITLHFSYCCVLALSLSLSHLAPSNLHAALSCRTASNGSMKMHSNGITKTSYMWNGIDRDRRQRQ